MQDRYAGDIGDFIKLGLLRALAPGRRLGVGWFKTPDETHNGDGRHTGYLRRPSEWRSLDPDLFDHLSDSVEKGERSVRMLIPMLPADAVHHDAVLRDCRERSNWWGEFQSVLGDANLVFVDPDNGLAPSRLTPKQAKSIKSIFWSEVAALRRPGRTLVIYHHQTRAKGGHQAEAEVIANRLIGEGADSVLALRARSWSPRLFILVDPDDGVSAAAIRFADKWKRAVSIAFQGGRGVKADNCADLIQFRPLSISQSPPSDPDLRRAVRILSMVHELHKVGYQRLRIVPGMSPSGCYWRCAIVPAHHVLENGWQPRWFGSHDEEGPPAVTYSTGAGACFFAWADAESDNARQLALKFIDRYPELAREGLGVDLPYAGWLTLVLGQAEAGQLPVFYADFGNKQTSWLPPPPPQYGCR